MNRLQSLAGDQDFCVSLNANGSIRHGRVLRRMIYEHPLYTRAAIRAQNRWSEISGKNHTHFCGAYWFYGFHEDGVRSGMRVCRDAGSKLRVIPDPSLYTGTLRHRRFRPREHQFSYKLFMAWLDIDRIPELMARLPWTDYNSFNWASFHEQDHFGDPCLTLRERVAEDARAHGIALPDGPIFLLTHLRYAGYCLQSDLVLFLLWEQRGSRERFWRR